MHIYLPIAEMSVPVESLAGIGLAMGLLSGLFGVGGGFLATPILLFMGVPPSVAVGTQACQLVATSMTGVLGHWRRGNVDVRMGVVMAGGGVVGVIIGALIFRLLQYIGQVDLFIAASYVVLLGSIGGMMMIESAMIVLRRAKPKASNDILANRPFFQNLPYKMRFAHSGLYISAILPVAIGVISGLLVSVLGIGGGFITVPAMIYMLGMPGLVAAGTTLFQVIFVSGVACIIHATFNHSVDMILGLVLIGGGVVGAQVGVFISRHFKGAPARLTLAVIILGVCIRMIAVMFLPPDQMFAMDVR